MAHQAEARVASEPIRDSCAQANYCPGDIEILKHHRSLLAAASALLNHKVAEEYETTLALVFATLSDRDEVYARIGERLAAARHDVKDRTELYEKPSLCCGDIRPNDSIGGVPIV